MKKYQIIKEFATQAELEKELGLHKNKYTQACITIGILCLLALSPMLYAFLIIFFEKIQQLIIHN